LRSSWRTAELKGARSISPTNRASSNDSSSSKMIRLSNPCSSKSLWVSSIRLPRPPCLRFWSPAI
jgi:hypothetical protein